jgi:UDP-N-acetylglucosamine--N-acetylmuramyl-(pentapeptide) pyrophosphoryl-undecaprenol N-acetylglucosamine transferase
MTASAPRAYLFAGGGTGGHIFPGLAIAEQLRALGPARCLFLCSDRPLDARILAREHAHYRVVPAKPFGVRPRALLRFLRSWAPAVRAARRAIGERLRAGEEVRVVAMGGFVAAPVVQAARAEGVPVLLVNMDAVPGKANRWIARHAARVVTSAPVEGETWERIPPIVRAAATATGDAAACRAALGLDPRRATLLVTGASQGARSINTLLIELVRAQPAAFDGWQMIHQTGANEDEAVRRAYEAAGIPADVRPFFEGMGTAWGAADLAVSRAGAGSVAEAWANGVPTLFLPYPYHKDQHQRANARPLETAGAAIITDDLIDPARNATGAGRVLIDLLRSTERRDAMRRALAALGPADGAARVAAILME